jgi:hypothetical protein
MIGMISGEDCREYLLHAMTHRWFFTSVRAKIRDEVDGYSASSDYWLRCLYAGETGDPGDVEKGFLKSRLLVKVRLIHFSANLYVPDNPPLRRSRLYSHLHPQRKMTMTSKSITRKGANLLGTTLQSDQTMRKITGWMDVLLLVPSHMRQCRCGTLFISLLNLPVLLLASLWPHRRYDLVDQLQRIQL